MMQTLITFFGCLVLVFIYNAHAYATLLFHTDYWNRIAFSYLNFLTSFLAVITGCGGEFYSVILIGMIWIDLSLCNLICVDALGQPFSCRAPMARRL